MVKKIPLFWANIFLFSIMYVKIDATLNKNIEWNYDQENFWFSSPP